MAKAEQAKILAAQSLTLSDEHDFSTSQRSLRLSWSEPRATLGHAAEGVAQVRQD
jgi:hypothetical protein